jgi:hypothetical protein
MSIFSQASPEELARARAAVPPEQLASWDAAAKAEGITLPTEAPDAAIAHLARSHGVELNAQPTAYRFEWREPEKITMDDVKAVQSWAATQAMPNGFAASILDRMQETAAEVAALSPADLADRKARAAAMLGDAQYAAIVAKAKTVAGDIKFLKPGQIETDMYLASTLARFADAKASLAAEIAKRAAK